MPIKMPVPAGTGCRATYLLQSGYWDPEGKLASEELWVGKLYSDWDLPVAVEQSFPEPVGTGCQGTGIPRGRWHPRSSGWGSYIQTGTYLLL